MSTIRRLLVPLTLAWLFLHVSVVAGTNASLLTTGGSEADVICTCGHGADHGSCQMHRKPADSTRCRLQSPRTDLDLALIAMLGPLASPAVSVDILAAVSGPRPSGYDATPPLDWTAPPDAPPPRS